MLLITLGVFFLAKFGKSAAKTCYAPDGTPVEDDIYAPCIAIEGVESMCCRINDTNPDECRADGLCYTNMTGYAGYWRDFCTDETWDTPNCLSKSICNTTAGGNSSWTYYMTPCGGVNYCCGDDPSCCSGDSVFSIKDTLVTIGGVATTTVTATSSAEVNGTSSGSSDESTKLAIGLGVAIPLTAIAGAMLGAGFFWGRKITQRKWLQATNHGGTAGPLLQPILQQGIAPTYHQSYPHEVSASQLSPTELPGGK
ncbi:uncharacterized protein AKAW2_10002A [Aspergillus luchuensis]|uniref:Uncharacterized protein n=1 Tax=Aspergillus kawachii TaxID=1069201 RepID=A0A7R7VY99_ASPKA|nr:uncharacterized protein AKAW2_10002A [Aspergillus luchuensis]BCR92956.1 hypothetical protein AKAW2_10002A [Aspergillus luchuensis]GAA93285.1 hypothetical protein AKAW_11397 [Aspergillus luchuensis IFO 4308]